MKNRILLISLTCALTVLPLRMQAQSMSESEIIQYVVEQKEKGKDQQTIALELTRKGVSADQLMRIKEKYESQGYAFGAEDLFEDASGSKGKKSEDRLRTNQELDNGRNQYYVSSGSLDDKAKLKAEKINSDKVLGKGAGSSKIDSILYSRNLLKGNKVYGRDIFNNDELSWLPNLNMATPSDYVLGAGDALYIDIWGASQQEIECTVSPDGTIVIEEVGPIRLGGMKVEEANNYLKEKLGSFYSDCNVALTLGQTRSIVVQVLGEVMVPGTYNMGSLSTAFNALYAAGGVADVGTLRDIKVYRNGSVIATIDVYDFLLNGNTEGNVRLEDNDVILVGTYDCLVKIDGKVKRPMYYEMKSTETLEQLIEYAGGFSGDAYTKNIRVLRKSGEEYSIHTVRDTETASFQVSDCDSVYVDAVVARFNNMVEIRGAVNHPGLYELSPSISTVKQLVDVAGGLKDDAFMERAVMHREKDDLTLEMISVDLEGVVSGTAEDITLKKNDVLFVPSKRQLQGDLTFKINGEVRFPGIYTYVENTTIKDLIIQAGGLTRAASTAKIDVFRRLFDPSAAEVSDVRSEVFSFSLENGFVLDEDTTFYLMPDDEVQVRKSPVFNQVQNVSVSGFVNFEGEYSITTTDFRVSDLIENAGGLTGSAYTKGARLIRQMNDDELSRKDPSDTRSFYDVAVDLEKAIGNPKSEYDIVLRDGDHLIVPEINSTVKISGDVMYPISINYAAGKNMKYYIRNAGGFGKLASKSQTYVIYMNGSVNKLGRRAGSSKIEPGCEIVVPTKPKRNGWTPSETLSMATSILSLATIVVTLINTSK